MGKIFNTYELKDSEKVYLGLTDDNLKHYNAHHKAKLSVDYTADNGMCAKILKNGKVILSGMTIENVYYAVAAIINYQEAK